MGKKEVICLDAVLKTVLSHTAFGAELRNGHEIVAFYGRDDIGKYLLAVGDKVTVEMSPFDMSKGKMVINQGQ